MLRTCQSRLAFSKSKWYVSAINTVFKPILLAHTRRSSTAVLEDTTLPEKQQHDRIIKRDDFQRCDGYRVMDGGRCKRLVRVEGSGPVFCYQHSKKPSRKKSSSEKRVSDELKKEAPPIPLLLKSPDGSRLIDGDGLLRTPDKLFDCWQLWLGNHLDNDVKESLLKEMMKPINRSEKPGYIYVYTLQSGPRVSGKGQTYFKIGRTINPHRRMYQFYTTCNHEPKIVELFPSFPSQPRTTITNLEIFDNDEEKLDQLPKCPLPHRVEKLIHLELFSMFKKAGFKCATCDTEHREWIKVVRTRHPVENRDMTDHELWLLYIRPVIVKWIQFGVLANAWAERL